MQHTEEAREELMERQPVTSSQIASVGYDARREELEIEFHSGGIYRYYRVPEKVYNDLMQAESKGKFFNSQIKGSYEFKKIAQLERA